MSAAWVLVIVLVVGAAVTITFMFPAAIALGGIAIYVYQQYIAPDNDG